MCPLYSQQHTLLAWRQLGKPPRDLCSDGQCVRRVQQVRMRHQEIGCLIANRAGPLWQAGDNLAVLAIDLGHDFRVRDQSSRHTVTFI